MWVSVEEFTGGDMGGLSTGFCWVNKLSSHSAGRRFNAAFQTHLPGGRASTFTQSPAGALGRKQATE